MEKFIQAHTVYNEQAYLDFCRFHFRKKAWYHLAILYILGAMAVLGTAFQLFTFGFSNLHQLLRLLPLGVVGIAFIVAALYLPRMLANSMIKNNRQYFNAVVIVTFGPDSFTSLNERDHKEYTLDYQLITSAYESEEYFYLYLNRFNAHIVRKNGLQAGASPAQLRQLLFDKLGTKKMHSSY